MFTKKGNAIQKMREALFDRNMTNSPLSPSFRPFEFEKPTEHKEKPSVFHTSFFFHSFILYISFILLYPCNNQLASLPLLPHFAHFSLVFRHAHKVYPSHHCPLPHRWSAPLFTPSNNRSASFFPILQAQHQDRAGLRDIFTSRLLFLRTPLIPTPLPPTKHRRLFRFTSRAGQTG